MTVSTTPIDTVADVAGRRERWNDPLPTVGEIVRAIRAGCAEPCVQMPSRTPVDPPEVWIAGLHAWLRCDGQSYSADYERGYAYPGLIGRWRIRLAVRAHLSASNDIKGDTK